MAVRYTNEEKYSLSIAVWLADDDYDHSPVEGPYISATGLLKPIRMIVLEQRAKALKQASGELEVIDISRFVPSRLGTAIHAGIENTWLGKYKTALRNLGYPQKVIDLVIVNPSKEQLKLKGIVPVYMEQRAFKTLLGFTIGGMFDFIGNGTLEDYKSMGVYSFMKGDKDEDQRAQGSIYRWLNPDIVTSNHMLIQQIFTDWSKLDAMKRAKAGYPQQRIVAKRLELWSFADTEKWITNRLKEIINYQDTPEAELPRCSQKDLWQNDTTYSYFGITKAGALSKVATTKCGTNMALAYETMAKKGGTGEVKEFPGLVRRCGYCNAFDICSQKNEYEAAGLLKMP